MSRFCWNIHPAPLEETGNKKKERDWEQAVLDYGWPSGSWRMRHEQGSFSAIGTDRQLSVLPSFAGRGTQL